MTNGTWEGSSGREGAEILPTGGATRHGARQAPELGVVVVFNHERVALGIGELLNDAGDIGVGNSDVRTTQGLLLMKWELY